MKKCLLSAVCSVGLPLVLSGALQETALFPVAPGTKALPVQTEAVHPDFKETPSEETGKVPEFTPAEKRSGMMIFSRPLTTALALFTVFSFAFPLTKIYIEKKRKAKAAQAEKAE